MSKTTFRRGDIVLYSPIMLPDEPKFVGVVREKPWQLGCGTWVTHLTGLSKAYGDFVKCPGRAYVHAARFEALELAPTIYCKSKRAWRKRSARDNERVDHEVFYVLLGAVGTRWAWQAGSKCGSSESYEAARAKVEELCE